MGLVIIMKYRNDGLFDYCHLNLEQNNVTFVHNYYWRVSQTFVNGEEVELFKKKVTLGKLSPEIF